MSGKNTAHTNAASTNDGAAEKLAAAEAAAAQAEAEALAAQQAEEDAERERDEQALVPSEREVKAILALVEKLELGAAYVLFGVKVVMVPDGQGGETAARHEHGKGRQVEGVVLTKTGEAYWFLTNGSADEFGEWWGVPVDPDWPKRADYRTALAQLAAIPV